MAQKKNTKKPVSKRTTRATLDERNNSLGKTDAPKTRKPRAKKDDAWTADKTPAGQKVRADKISAVLGSLTTIRFSDTNDLGDANFAAAKANARAFKLTTFDGKTVSVTLGRKPEEKKLKAAAPAADGKTGPASLGSVADLM